MKRTRIRQRTDSPARAYYRSVMVDRADWAASQPQRCMVCHLKPDYRGLQVHEIARRSSAPGRWWHRCNALLVDAACHEGPLATMSHAEQLAIKYAEDNGEFNLERWLELIGRGPEYVTLAEVQDWARKHREGD